MGWVGVFQPGTLNLRVGSKPEGRSPKPFNLGYRALLLRLTIKSRCFPPISPDEEPAVLFIVTEFPREAIRVFAGSPFIDTLPVYFAVLPFAGIKVAVF